MQMGGLVAVPICNRRSPICNLQSTERLRPSLTVFDRLVMTDIFDRLKTALADRYAIERELGAGGTATVYLAEDLKHHRKVAVKVSDRS